MTVFKIYINGISDGNLIFRSDVSTALTGYGDTILSPKLKKEANKADSFEFMILPSHEEYDSFEKKKTFVFLTRDDKCIFRGRVSDIKTDIYKQRTISCEGDLAFLSDSVQAPNKKNTTETVGSTKKHKNSIIYSTDGGRTYTSTNKNTLKMTPEAYFRTCIDVHNGQMTNSNKNFTVGSVTVSGKGTNEYFERTSYQDTSSVISSDLLSVYGGVLRTRYENGQAYIDWLDAYTETNSQEIRFGVNMIDLDQEPPTDEIWSVLLPTGEENCTIESKNNGSKFLENSDAIAQYGYIVHHHAFSNVKKADELLTKARKYMSTHCKIFPNNLVIKAIDLQLIGESTDPLELGDKIKVVSSPHGLNKTMACIAMELDIYNPENNSYTIGTILPPDKEKKKEPLSEKHKNSNGFSSRGIANNANSISGLQNDVNVNANNINVNAENIAVNALNIAVNAENIAVVAKNIAIAADTIDIKAQQITATFGEETDELYGHITTSAEGIKTEFHDNTTGLSSYFTQEAGKITAAVENAEGTIRSKIELTESSLISQFNETIYGEDGIVTDYEGKITQTATSLTSDYTQQITDSEGRITSAYEGKIEQTATSLTSDYTAKISNSEQTITNAYEGKITQTATSLTSDYTTKISNAKTEVTEAYESKITQTSQSISSEVSKKVGKEEIISSINQTAESVIIDASKINLSGYVTASQLQTTNANITNLVNGTTTASYLSATKMKVTTGNFYIGDNDNKSGKFYYHGTEYYNVMISMPNVGASNGFLGWAYEGGNYPTTLSLAHSHSVTTNSDGTITLGGTVATDSPAENRSFKIADTKAYKDGVSAATNSVTITSLNKDPDASVEYDSDRNKYTVPLKAVASNLNSKTANYTFFATAAYNAGNTDGVNSVTITSLNKDPSASVSYDTANNKYTIPLKAVASNSNSKTANYTFFATDAYDTGYTNGLTDGTPNDSTWSIPNWSSEKDWQLVAVIDDGDGVYDCATFRVQFNDNKGETHRHTFAKIPCWDVYNHGVNSVTITSVNKDSSASVSYDATNNKYTVPLKAVASNSKTKTENYTFFATDAYDNGVNSVTITSVNKDPSASVSYDTANNKYTVPLKAVASNSNSKTANYTFFATDAYNAGKTDESIDDSSWSIPQFSDAYPRQMVAVADDNDGVRDCVTFRVTANKSGGGTVTHTFRKIPCWDVYNHGVNSVTITSVNKDPSASVSYDTANNKYTIPLKAVASNSNSNTANYTFFATDAYNAGQTAGTDSVTPSSAWIRDTSVAVADDDSRKDCANIYLTISSSNEKTKNINLRKVPMWMVYDEGRKDCITKDATVTGVTINANGSADVHLKWSDYTRTINVNSRYVSDNHN